MGRSLRCGEAYKRRRRSNKKSRQAKPKVVHINRLKPYAGREPFDWFVDKGSAVGSPLNESNSGMAELNVKSLLPSLEATSNRDNDRKNQDSVETVTALRRSERNRRRPQRYTT